MIKWKRPSGSIIETNDSDDTIVYAVANGWERVEVSIVEGSSGECHKSAINGMDSKKDILDYLESISIEIDTKGNLLTTRKRALEAIEDDNSIADSERGS